MAKTKDFFIVAVTLIAALVLHALSNASLSSSKDGTWSGIFGTPDSSSGDSAAIAELLVQRSALVSEISEFQKVVSQLEKVRHPTL